MTFPYNSIPSNNPQNLALSYPVGMVITSRNPGTSDNIYTPGTEWQNNVTGVFYKCVSSGVGGAIWDQITGPSVFEVLTLQGNSGGMVPPDITGNLKVQGDGTTINVVGSVSGHSLTISAISSGLVESLTPDSGTSPVVPAAGTITVAGSGSTTTVGGTNILTIELTGLTDHNILAGAGTTTITKIAPSATSGVPLISQGASSDPLFGTVLVAGGGTGAVTLTGVLIGNGTSAVTGNPVTQHDVLVGGASNAVTSVAPSATSGIPLVSNGASSDPSFTTAVVAGGGTGATSFTAYAVLCGGTTSTGVLQNVSGVGTVGQILTSNGASALPSWQGGGAGSVNVTPVNHAASPYTVLDSDQFLAVDSSGGTVSILLPNAPTTGRVVYIKDSKGSTQTHAISVTTVGGVVTIDGSTTYSLSVNYQAISVIFDSANFQVF